MISFSLTYVMDFSWGRLSSALNVTSLSEERSANCMTSWPKALHVMYLCWLSLDLYIKRSLAVAWSACTQVISLNPITVFLWAFAERWCQRELCTVGKACRCLVLELQQFAMFLMVVVSSCLGGASATLPRSAIGVIVCTWFRHIRILCRTELSYSEFGKII